MNAEIRPALQSDLPAITEIYNEAVLKTNATFDTVPKTLKEQEVWFTKHGKKHPIFVAMTGAQLIGWASLSLWSDRQAYDETAEVSFYVHADFRGQGVGRKLLEKLDREAASLGFHTLVSRIGGDSEVSIHLHQSLGFTLIGTMREVGRKFGKRLDVHLMQKWY